MAGTPYLESAHLFAADTFTFQGAEYVITKVNPANYQISRLSDGKRFNLNRRAVGIVKTGQDYKAYHLAIEVKVAAKVERSGADVNDESVGVLPNGFPRFKSGTKIRIVTGRNTKWEGVEGLIARVNKTRYAVVVEGKGQVNVPFSMARSLAPVGAGLDF